jgi:hypothetical protein
MVSSFVIAAGLPDAGETVKFAEVFVDILERERHVATRCEPLNPDRVCGMGRRRAAQPVVDRRGFYFETSRQKFHSIAANEALEC